MTGDVAAPTSWRLIVAASWRVGISALGRRALACGINNNVVCGSAMAYQSADSVSFALIAAQRSGAYVAAIIWPIMCSWRILFGVLPTRVAWRLWLARQLIFVA